MFLDQLTHRRLILMGSGLCDRSHSMLRACRRALRALWLNKSCGFIKYYCILHPAAARACWTARAVKASLPGHISSRAIPFPLPSCSFGVARPAFFGAGPLRPVLGGWLRMGMWLLVLRCPGHPLVTVACLARRSSTKLCTHIAESLPATPGDGAIDVLNSLRAPVAVAQHDTGQRGVLASNPILIRNDAQAQG
jgi:hypothetical protein